MMMSSVQFSSVQFSLFVHDLRHTKHVVLNMALILLRHLCTRKYRDFCEPAAEHFKRAYRQLHSMWVGYGERPSPRGHCPSPEYTYLLNLGPEMRISAHTRALL